MRIYMQTQEAGKSGRRFYHMHIQEDLLEGWTLVKETGYQGQAGKITHQHYIKWDEAVIALQHERDKQTRRGYQVVFVEGQACAP